VIDSADEYRQWWGAPQSLERVQAMRGSISVAVLREVVSRFPECRADVARRRDTPPELLAVLRGDDDENVRWRVRSNGRWVKEHPEDAEPWCDDPTTLIQFRLSGEERDLLRAGLLEWGGPANCTDELAVAMGFQNVQDLFEQGSRIAKSIAEGQPQTRTDWTRALLATEIAFVSDVMGSGWDWSITTGYSDDLTLRTLRALQRKMVTGGVVGVVFGTRPPT
jgi:hypothetical protein